MTPILLKYRCRRATPEAKNLRPFPAPLSDPPTLRRDVSVPHQLRELVKEQNKVIGIAATLVLLSSFTS